MSRLDDLGEILDGYEGRTKDITSLLDEDAQGVYALIYPELQQKLAKYFQHIQRTGVIRVTYCEMEDLETLSLEKSPNFFNEYIMFLAVNWGGLKEFEKDVEEIIKIYKQDEQNR